MLPGWIRWQFQKRKEKEEHVHFYSYVSWEGGRLGIPYERVNGALFAKYLKRCGCGDEQIVKVRHAEGI